MTLSRFVLDTNVLVSAALFTQSKPATVLRRVQDSGVLLISVEILNELKEVLKREKFDRYVTKSFRRNFQIVLTRRSTLIEPQPTVNICRDPKDNHILDLAISGQANFIITGDDDLLVLNPFEDIVILTPDDWLKIQ